MKVTLDACIFGAHCASFLHEKKHYEQGLDIGSGTGLLSLMVAQKGLKHITGIELDSAAAHQSIENIHESPYANKITIENMDIKNFQSQHKFDVIISNPPFFTNQLKGPDAKRNAARHNDGLSFQTLAACIKQNMSEQGVAWILLPFNEYTHFTECAIQQSLTVTSLYKIRSKIDKPFHRVIFSLVHTENDQRNRHATISEHTYTINTMDNGQLTYDEEISNLLKDYYLKL